MAVGFGFQFDPLNFIGGLMNMSNQNKLAQRQEDMQREFAQNSIQWRVNDAKKAGIHPVAALGSQGISYNPSYVGGDDFGGSQASISYTPEKKVDEKTQAYNDKVNELNLRMQEANTREAEANATLAERSLISNPKNTGGVLFGAAQTKGSLINQTGIGHSASPTSMPGQASVNPYGVADVNNAVNFTKNMDGSVSLMPSHQTGIGHSASPTSMPGQASVNPYGVADVNNAVNFTKNMDGSVSLMPSQDIQDLVSESTLERGRWWLSQYATDPKLRSGIVDSLVGKGKDIPKGYVLRANPFTLNYELVPESKAGGWLSRRASPAFWFKSRKDFINGKDY